MKGNDISNSVVPRLLVVFEGLLGFKDDPSTVTKIRRRLGRKDIVTTEDWQMNEPMMHAVWDMVWRRGYTVDVVTFLGDEFATALTERFDDEGLPIGRVLSTKPNLLARKLAYMPDVAAVYDPEPSRRFTYGSKGVPMDPSRPDFFGRF